MASQNSTPTTSSSPFSNDRGNNQHPRIQDVRPPTPEYHNEQNLTSDRDQSNSQRNTSPEAYPSRENTPRYAPQRGQSFQGRQEEQQPEHHTQTEQSSQPSSENISLADVQKKQQERKIKGFAQKIVGRLNESIEKGNNVGPYIFMMLIAGAKDFLDLGEDAVVVLIQAIPAIGQAGGLIMEIVYGTVTIAVTGILYAFMLQNGWLKNKMIRRKAIILRWAFTGLEIIPIIGFFPFQTLMVIMTFNEIKKHAKKAEAKKKKLNKLSLRELQKLDANYEEEVGKM